MKVITILELISKNNLKIELHREKKLFKISKFTIKKWDFLKNKQSLEEIRKTFRIIVLWIWTLNRVLMKLINNLNLILRIYHSLNRFVMIQIHKNRFYKLILVNYTITILFINWIDPLFSIFII